jgi:hypothetical protein
MLAGEHVERAVELQSRGYRLLQWLEKAFSRGLVAPETMHQYATMEESALAWVTRHYGILPNDARPAEEDLVPFSKLFSTYLLNTFDLEDNPGERLYSPGAHCFCPICSWMIRVPHLRPKKIGTADKAIAERMKRNVVRDLAVDVGNPISDRDMDRMLDDPDLREPIGLCAYATDLLQRLEGVAVGPASLALWRSFAWTPEGSPKKGFALSAEAILDAQRTIVQKLVPSKGE